MDPFTPDFLAELGLDEGQGDNNAMGGGGGPALNDDVERIITWWKMEEAAPELLPFQQETVTDLYELIDTQQQHVDASRNTAVEAESALFYQMDLDRVRFVLGRYLKSRLRKIEKYILYVALQPEEARKKLSDNERQFAAGYVELLEKHLTEGVLQHLPQAFQSLTDDSQALGGAMGAHTRMVDPPDLDRFVFCRVMRDVGRVQVDDSPGANLSDGSVQDLEKGDVHVIKYRVAQPYIDRGDIELM